MKLLNYSALVILAFTASASAAVVSFGTGGARGHEFVISGSGARVNVSTNVIPTNTENRLVVGYLTTPGLASSFTEFSRTTINNPITTATIGGFVSVATPNNTSTTALAAMKSSQVAIWVFGQGGAQGMFTSPDWVAPSTVTTELDSSWFVNLGVAQGSAALNVAVVPISGLTGSRFDPNTPITVGTSGNTSGSRYTLGVVPEPSVSLMGLIGAIGFLARRRR